MCDYETSKTPQVTSRNTKRSELFASAFLNSEPSRGKTALIMTIPTVVVRLARDRKFSFARESKPRCVKRRADGFASQKQKKNKNNKGKGADRF